MNKSKKTIICIAIAVVVIICAVILKNTVFAPKGAFKEGSSGVIEYSGYNVEGLHYGFNTQQECYLKTDNYNGVKEIDVNFAETAEQDVVLSLKFFDKDGNTLVLRPDITPSIARASATLFKDENLPIRLCYTGNTFVNHSSYQGRLRETTQMGAEFVGDDSVEADAEMLALVIESMLTIGLKEFQLCVGNVDFFQSLIEDASLAVLSKTLAPGFYRTDGFGKSRRISGQYSGKEKLQRSIFSIE